MATSTSPTPPPHLTTSPFPFASAPDIIRAHQKDAYFQGLLASQLRDLHRRLLGARSAHAWAAEASTLADLLYLSLTTLLGNRTLGEEYCDLVQVEPSHRLPSLARRAAYIALSTLVPYVLERPRLALPARLARALVLAAFYFSGAYYSLSKRLVGLRYIFTRRPDPAQRQEAAAGYEVLGVLLVTQLAVQAWLHVRARLAGIREQRAATAAPADVSLDHEYSYGSGNNDLLLPLSGTAAAATTTRSQRSNKAAIGAMTHTPVPEGQPPQDGDGDAVRYNLKDDSVLAWIKGRSQRKCTLCLEELRDPAATGCGHVFCWGCIGDWVREKPECPLCRREVMVQHILPLRVVA